MRRKQRQQTQPRMCYVQACHEYSPEEVNTTQENATTAGTVGRKREDNGNGHIITYLRTVISFDEEEDTVDQGTGTTSTEILLNPPMAMIVPQKHQSTLQ